MAQVKIEEPTVQAQGHTYSGFATEFASDEEDDIIIPKQDDTFLIWSCVLISLRYFTSGCKELMFGNWNETETFANVLFYCIFFITGTLFIVMYYYVTRDVPKWQYPLHLIVFLVVFVMNTELVLDQILHIKI